MEKVDVQPTAPQHHIHVPHDDHGALLLNKWGLVALVIVAVLVIVNQYFILGLSGGPHFGSSSGFISLHGGSVDLSNVDVNKIESTPQGIAALFPVKDIKNADDAVQISIPTGTPEYGQAMAVSSDDPVKSLDLLARAYPALKKQAEEKPEVWQRYLNLAAAPRGISCEFCCGVGPQGVDAKGTSRCGCSHNPALQSVTLWLMLNTDYSDAQVLKEVYLWTSLFFPKDMVQIALKISGGDTSVLEDLPGMVGGC